MPAVIRVSLKTSPTGVPVPPTTEGVSRNDLRKGYEVTCTSVHTETSYSWSLSFAPETSGPEDTEPDTNAYARVNSNASLSSTTAQQTKFVVDNEGSYLVRLVTDAGLGTEDVQFVRLRVMTVFGELFLISAGERRDESGVIPVDVSAQGWANEQNSNIQRLMLLVRRLSMSGRVLYVDANRGRKYSDSSVQPNDPTNIIRMPGPETGREDETGMRTACEGFADFSSITAAMAYAATCAARGETPLSADDPYIIKVAPGVYQEDLTLIPHVHLIADTNGEVILTDFGTAQMNGATVYTTANPGAHHTYTGSSVDDFLLLRGIGFLNGYDKTEPIFHQRGGFLMFEGCQMIQGGAHATQGPIILAEKNGAIPPAVILKDSLSYMETGNAALYSIIMADIGVVYGLNSNIMGDSAVLFNSNFQDDPDGGEVRFDKCWVRAMTLNGYIFRGLPGTFVSNESEFDNEDTTVNPNLAFELADTSGVLAGPGLVGYDANISINNSAILQDIRVRTDQTLGDVNFYPASIRLGGSYIFPTGAPNEWTPTTRGESLLYDNAYTDPLYPVSPLTVLPTNKVQNAIDMLVGAALPLGAVPYYSLDSAYDGLADLQPITYGDGLGRRIVADAGAVQISGAESPADKWLEDTALKGGLQIEGNLDIGPFVSGSPNGALDNLGSEINLRPGTWSGASMISLGRSVDPNDLAGSATHRAFPGGFIMGGNPNAMNATDGHAPFNLHLRTRNNYESDTDELGRIVLNGGEAYPNLGSVGSGSDTQGGHVYVQGGTCYQPSGGAPFSELGGHIWLAPGMTMDAASIGSGTTASKIRICLLDENVTWATLQAAGPFVPGGSGVFYLSGPNGMEHFQVSAGDALADVINTVNLSSYQFIAQDAGGGVLEIMSLTPGPNGDVLFVASNPASLNTNLGDLQVATGATFTPGAYSKYVDIGCTDTDELTVFGDLHATGDITAGGTCCGGGGGGPVYEAVNFAVGPNPYLLNVNTTIAGIRNPGALPGRTAVLPAAAPVGHEMTLKDETATAGAAPVTIVDALLRPIEGLPALLLNVNGQSYTIYFNGTQWFII